MANDQDVRALASRCVVIRRAGRLHEREVSTLRARLEGKLTAVLTAASDCGTDVNNPDTCGVCRLHFAECEVDQYCVGDEVNEHDVPIGREPACPGARVRAALYGMKAI